MSHGGAGALGAEDDFSPSMPGRLRVSRGSEGAEGEFEAIFLEHYESVLRVLLRLTGNRAQAEELANEVFWRLSRKSSSWLVTNNVGGWLYRTATRAGIDAIRASANRSRYERAAFQDTEAASGALSELLRQEEQSRIRRALACMKPVRAQILLMGADGASYQEISEALGVRTGSVGTLLKRAEGEFRKRYLREEKR